MAYSCYVCEKKRPCCCQPLHQIKHSKHVKVVRPLKGEKWRLGRVWHGNDETLKFDSVFLVNNEDQAMELINHVKSFL